MNATAILIVSDNTYNVYITSLCSTLITSSR